LSMDTKKIKERLKGESDRIRMSLYLSSSVFSDFKDTCGELSPSRVIEELMKEFIESNQKKAPVKVKSKK
jgi:hypothetical protein